MIIPLSARDKVIIHVLKYLSEHAGSLKPSQLDWCIKLETAYKERGNLSPRELEILIDIYSQY